MNIMYRRTQKNFKQRCKKTDHWNSLLLTTQTMFASCLSDQKSLTNSLSLFTKGKSSLFTVTNDN